MHAVARDQCVLCGDATRFEHKGRLVDRSAAAVEAVLARFRDLIDEGTAQVGELLRRGEKIPGFGHFVYRSDGPRAVVLPGLVRRAAPKSGQLAVAEAVLAEVRLKSLPEPNIDFAVATLAQVAGMVPGGPGRRYSRSPARPAGSPTALGAYAGGGPLRPRAVYTGPPAIIGP